MGATLCGFGQKSPKRPSKNNSDDRHVVLTTSIIKFMKPICLWTAKKKKRQLQPQGKQQLLLKKMNQLNTLEDWLSTSPGLNEGSLSGGEFHVLKQFSNRVHPSLASEHEDKSAVHVCEVDAGEMQDSSLSKSQSVKMKKKKKRVSFRLPEVADIIVLDLSDESY